MSNNFKNVKEYFKYNEFIDLVEQLVIDGKTSGPNQSDALIGFTKLNAQRMKRVTKTTKLNDDLIDKLKKLPQQTWWVVTEAWCGDSAQSLPIIAKLAEVSEGKIDLRVILRDDNLDVMDKYLTNGGRSIPKLVMRKGVEDINTWGPRPEKAQGMLIDWKVNPDGKSHDDFEQELHTWYAKDRGVTTIEELSEILN